MQSNEVQPLNAPRPIVRKIVELDLHQFSSIFKCALWNMPDQWMDVNASHIFGDSPSMDVNASHIFGDSPSYPVEDDISVSTAATWLPSLADIIIDFIVREMGRGRVHLAVQRQGIGGIFYWGG